MTGPSLTFPLATRFRLLGVPFGSTHSSRRGLGSDIAGSRPYRPGDAVAAIDWHASARLSSARSSDEFIVRDRFADESPRVVALVDRRPAMALYPPELPWLCKADALRMATELIAMSAYAVRGLAGYLDLAQEDPFWTPPSSEGHWQQLQEEYRARPFTAKPDNLAEGLDFLRTARMSLPPGSFVFVLSDFLVAPPPEAWLAAVEHRWDVIPVVVQDPIWEQSFPDVSGITLPFLDAETGRRETVRLTRVQARDVREANEHRLRRLLDGFAALGIEPVVVGSAAPQALLRGFLEWADRRVHAGSEWRLGA